MMFQDNKRPCEFSSFDWPVFAYDGFPVWIRRAVANNELSLRVAGWLYRYELQRQTRQDYRGQKCKHHTGDHAWQDKLHHVADQIQRKHLY